MIRKCSLMFSLIALTTFLSVQNPHAKPVGNRFTTPVTLGPGVFIVLRDFRRKTLVA